MRFQSFGWCLQWFQQVLLLLTILVVVSTCSHRDDGSSGRRCYEDAMDALSYVELDELMNSDDIIQTLKQNSTCTPCPSHDSGGGSSKLSGGGSATATEAATNDTNTRQALVLLRQLDERPDFIALISGMLNRGWQVTVLHLQQEYQNKDRSMDDLEDDILSSVPCLAESRSKSNLEISQINAGSQDSCSPSDPSNPFDSCNLQDAANMYHAIDAWWKRQGIQPQQQQNQQQKQREKQAHQGNSSMTTKNSSVVLMDASFLGGLLFSEVNGIPTVAVATYRTFITYIENDPQWSPQDWNILNCGIQLLRQRLQSLLLTSAFIRLNSIRRDVGLAPLRVPSHYFRPIVAMVVGFLPDQIEQAQIDAITSRSVNRANIIHNVGPLQPPCIACIDESAPTKGSSKRKPAALKKPAIGSKASILVLQPPKMSRTTARLLVGGLAIARASLDKYDDCDWDPMTCQNEARDFQVNWVLQQETPNNHEAIWMQSVLPAYINTETTYNIIDAYLRHSPQVAIVVTVCDADSEILSLLDVSVICIWQSTYLPPKTTIVNSSGGLGTWHEREFALHLLKRFRQQLGSHHHQQQQQLSENRQQQQQQGLHGDTSTSIDASRVIDERKGAGVANSGTVTSASPTLSNNGSRLVQQQSSRLDYHRNIMDDRYPLSGLLRALTVIETVHDVKMMHSPAWTTNEEMVATIQSALVQPSAKPDDDQLYDNFTVLVAWLVLFATIIYIVVKDTFQWKYPRRHSHRGDAFSEGILARLPDLDDAWRLLREWYNEQPSLRPDIAVHHHQDDNTTNHDGRNSSSRRISSRSNVDEQKQQQQQQQQSQQQQQNSHPVRRRKRR